MANQETQNPETPSSELLEAASAEAPDDTTEAGSEETPTDVAGPEGDNDAPEAAGDAAEAAGDDPEAAGDDPEAGGDAPEAAADAPKAAADDPEAAAEIAASEANGGAAVDAIAVAAAAEGISPELVADPYGEEKLDVSAADFEALLSEHADAIGDFREGEIVNAKVLRVTDSMVILECGFKSEGAVALDEFKDRDTIEPGQEVEVLLESLEDDDGIVVLSKKKADFLRVWERIREAHEADEPVEGVLTRKIKGGVTVDIMGVDAFLPGSQIALRRVPNIEDLLGQTFEFKIIKLNKRRRNIVVSRRVILEGERERKRETLVKELLVGQVREGAVKNVTDFGAFLDLGGLDGLLHITDMSWGRVGHPGEVVDIGAMIDVKVLDIDWDRERISLGLKQLMPYPWTDIDKKYPVGARVRGKVVSITNYGAFVELQKGVEGLVHISEMSWTRNIRHPSKLVNIGDEIEAVVLKVDPQDEKISLGMKQIEEDPWLGLPVKYPTGTHLAGTVRNLTSFGAFVEIEPGIDGLVHVSDMSWTKRVEHPSEIVQKGEEVQVLVLDVDAEAKRISLGIKQLQDDPWPGISERFSAGVEPEGTVARVQEKGVVVDLGDDIEGFSPTSHTGVDEGAVLGEYFRRGEALKLKVIESDAGNRRIVLEITEVPEQIELPEPEEEPEAEADGEDETAVGADAAEAPEAEAEPEEEPEEAAAEAADEPEAEAEPEDEPEEAAAEAADEPEAEAEPEDEPEEAAAEAADEPEAEAEPEDEPEEVAAEAADEPEAEAEPEDEPEEVAAEAADEPEAEAEPEDEPEEAAAEAADEPEAEAESEDEPEEAAAEAADEPEAEAEPEDEPEEVAAEAADEPEAEAEPEDEPEEAAAEAADEPEAEAESEDEPEEAAAEAADEPEAEAEPEDEPEEAAAEAADEPEAEAESEDEPEEAAAEAADEAESEDESEEEEPTASADEVGDSAEEVEESADEAEEETKEEA